MALHRTIETRDHAIEDVYSTDLSERRLPKYRLPDTSIAPSVSNAGKLPHLCQ